MKKLSKEQKAIRKAASLEMKRMLDPLDLFKYGAICPSCEIAIPMFRDVFLIHKDFKNNLCVQSSQRLK